MIGSWSSSYSNAFIYRFDNAYLLRYQVKYVLTERSCHDPLENYIGRQRPMGRRRDDPNLKTFGYQDNKMRNSNIFRPISGNSRKETPTF